MGSSKERNQKCPREEEAKATRKTTMGSSIEKNQKRPREEEATSADLMKCTQCATCGIDCIAKEGSNQRKISAACAKKRKCDQVREAQTKKIRQKSTEI
jgi:hypothetical protein